MGKMFLTEWSPYKVKWIRLMDELKASINKKLKIPTTQMEFKVMQKGVYFIVRETPVVTQSQGGGTSATATAQPEPAPSAQPTSPPYTAYTTAPITSATLPPKLNGRSFITEADETTDLMTQFIKSAETVGVFEANKYNIATLFPNGKYESGSNDTLQQQFRLAVRSIPDADFKKIAQDMNVQSLNRITLKGMVAGNLLAQTFTGKQKNIMSDVIKEYNDSHAPEGGAPSPEEDMADLSAEELRDLFGDAEDALSQDSEQELSANPSDEEIQQAIKELNKEEFLKWLGALDATDFPLMKKLAPVIFTKEQQVWFNKYLSALPANQRQSGGSNPQVQCPQGQHKDVNGNCVPNSNTSGDDAFDDEEPSVQDFKGKLENFFIKSRGKYPFIAKGKWNNDKTAVAFELDYADVFNTDDKETVMNILHESLQDSMTFDKFLTLFAGLGEDVVFTGAYVSVYGTSAKLEEGQSWIKALDPSNTAEYKMLTLQNTDYETIVDVLNLMQTEKIKPNEFVSLSKWLYAKCIASHKTLDELIKDKKGMGGIMNQLVGKVSGAVTTVKAIVGGKALPKISSPEFVMQLAKYFDID